VLRRPLVVALAILLAFGLGLAFLLLRGGCS